MVGSMRYLCNTVSDICYAVGMISRFMSKAKWLHYQAGVRILRYVKETLRNEIMFLFGVSDDVEMICYSNSD